MKPNPFCFYLATTIICLLGVALLLSGCASSGVVAVPIVKPCTTIPPKPIGPLPIDELTEKSSSAEIIQALWQTVQIQQRYIYYRTGQN